MLGVALLLLVTTAVPPAPAQQEDAFRAVVVHEWKARPAGGLPDLYKLVYQASMGPAHIGLDSAMARDWLAREWTSLDSAAAGEALLDTIAPQGAVVRLNLRPYRARGGSEAALVRAFVASARAIRPDTALLVRRWRLLERRGLPWSTADLRAFLARERGRGFPAPEHSAAYLKRYRPAYRVLSGAQADSLVASLRR